MLKGAAIASVRVTYRDGSSAEWIFGFYAEVPANASHLRVPTRLTTYFRHICVPHA